MYYGFFPSKDAHQTLAVDGTPKTLAQLGLTLQDNDSAMVDVQPTGGDIWFTRNQNSTPSASTSRGFKLLDGTICRLTREEVVVAKFVAATTVPLQCAPSIKPPWPQLG